MLSPACHSIKWNRKQHTESERVPNRRAALEGGPAGGLTLSELRLTLPESHRWVLAPRVFIGRTGPLRGLWVEDTVFYTGSSVPRRQTAGTFGWARLTGLAVAEFMTNWLWVFCLLF